MWTMRISRWNSKKSLFDVTDIICQDCPYHEPRGNETITGVGVYPALKFVHIWINTRKKGSQ